MSDELKALMDTATQARAKADELNAALTDESSDEERQAAAEAQQAAAGAESAFAEAEAKANADAAAQSGDGAEGPTDAERTEAAERGEIASGGIDPNASRTGFAEKGLHAGDECICPDGRKGTVHSFDAGLICIPNHEQG